MLIISFVCFSYFSRSSRSSRSSRFSCRSSEYSQLDKTQSGEAFIQENAYVDDAFNSNQVAFLQKYFVDHPVCVFFGEGLLGTVISQTLKPSMLIAAFYDKWFL